MPISSLKWHYTYLITVTFCNYLYLCLQCALRPVAYLVPASLQCFYLLSEHLNAGSILLHAFLDLAYGGLHDLQVLC